MKPILLSIFLLSSFVGWGQSFGPIKVVYHEYSPTSSDYDIIRWNVKDTIGLIWVLKETTDTLGRVIELEFLKNGEIIDDNLCYLPNTITYSYTDNTIIETNYMDYEPMMFNDCENVYKCIYHLAENDFIVKTESHSLLDTTNLSNEEINLYKKYYKPLSFGYPCNESEYRCLLNVDGYKYSFSKKDGLYPVSMNFDIQILIELQQFTKSELELIQKGIERYGMIYDY